jgi:hypothetical protein
MEVQTTAAFAVMLKAKVGDKLTREGVQWLIDYTNGAFGGNLGREEHTLNSFKGAVVKRWLMTRGEGDFDAIFMDEAQKSGWARRLRDHGHTNLVEICHEIKHKMVDIMQEKKELIKGPSHGNPLGEATDPACVILDHWSGNLAGTLTAVSHGATGDS